MAVRTKVIRSDDSVTELKAAPSLGILTVPVRQFWHGTLGRSIDSEISPYDILPLSLRFAGAKALARVGRAMSDAADDRAANLFNESEEVAPIPTEKDHERAQAHRRRDRDRGRSGARSWLLLQVRRPRESLAFASNRLVYSREVYVRSI